MLPFFLPTGAKAIAESLPAGLTELRLDVSEHLRKGIGNGGAAAIAERLPKGLTKLALAFSHCNIGDAGAVAVAQRIPRPPQPILVAHT